eukprot:525773-Pleurochrysis_carterae.AAC.4
MVHQAKHIFPGDDRVPGFVDQGHLRDDAEFMVAQTQHALEDLLDPSLLHTQRLRHPTFDDLFEIILEVHCPDCVHAPFCGEGTAVAGSVS